MESLRENGEALNEVKSYKLEQIQILFVLFGIDLLNFCPLGHSINKKAPQNARLLNLSLL
jgi:hypothetical protein